jgi:hypothetical protein
VEDLDRTEANKAVVRSLITDVLMAGGDPSAVDRCICAETDIRHDPDVATSALTG